MRRPGPLPEARRPAPPAESVQTTGETAPIVTIPRREEADAAAKPTAVPADAQADAAEAEPRAKPRRRRPGAVGGDEADVDEAGVDEADVEPVGWREVWRAARQRRRSLRAQLRRFTVRQRRRRLIWLCSIGALVLLVGGSFAAAYSPLFAVTEIRVVGTSQLDRAAVVDALSDQVGRPLPLVDHSEVKAALVAFPLIETYSLEARPPHDLVLRVVERTPVGVVTSDAGFTVVDAAGVALATTADPPEGQPVIKAKGGLGSDAFSAVAKVLRAIPAELRAQVSAASAKTPDDVTLTLGDTDTTVVWGSADKSARKALNLQQAMVNMPPGEVSVYDVSAPGAIVVQ